MKNIYKFCALITVICSSLVNAEGEFVDRNQLKNKYFLDWSNRTGLMTCRLADAPLIKKVKQCTVAAEGSGAFAECKLNTKHGRTLAFDTMKTCKEVKAEFEANSEE
jgi:hypothetical protein